jgi:hypothetical protein
VFWNEEENFGKGLTKTGNEGTREHTHCENALTVENWSEPLAPAGLYTLRSTAGPRNGQAPECPRNTGWLKARGCRGRAGFGRSEKEAGPLPPDWARKCLNNYVDSVVTLASL